MRKDTQWHRAHVVSIADACEGVREIVLDPGTAARGFEVGSHLDFRVQLHGRADVRSYSLVGEPRADGHYQIAVRQMPDSRASSAARSAGPAPSSHCSCRRSPSSASSSST